MKCVRRIHNIYTHAYVHTQIHATTYPDARAKRAGCSLTYRELPPQMRASTLTLRRTLGLSYSAAVSPANDTTANANAIFSGAGSCSLLLDFSVSSDMQSSFSPFPKGSSSPVLLIRIADISLSFYFFLSAFGFSSISLPPESSPLRPFAPRSSALPSPASFASPPSSWTSEEAGAADAVYRLRGSRECVQRCNYCKLPPRRERAFPARKFHTADTGS